MPIARFVITLVCFAPLCAQSQGFTVVHTLNGGSDGNQTINGLTMDRQGNLYGTAFEGGLNNCGDNYGCGTVFKLTRHGTQWTFSLLYRFTGWSDGWAPAAPLTIAPDGSIWGTTAFGGTNDCSGIGCGTVFRLQPPPTFCAAVSCPWTKTTLHQFTFGLDGAYPMSALIFDQAGNVYGTSTNSDLQRHRGSVWELSPSGSGWTFNVIYEFSDADGAGWPLGGVVFDGNGNLWGTGGFGGVQNCGNPQLPDDCGTIFELIPSASGWTEHTAFGFSQDVG
ncbi:MAG TPA: choice-of-anchor tandem repeat GloVer-containing protein, partial [Candidatus Binatia bacterium]|nr:choice-of-anchor tandem repeat GloVer-containing protein [Candidatus Binatia bacterium]